MYFYSFLMYVLEPEKDKKGNKKYIPADKNQYWMQNSLQYFSFSLCNHFTHYPFLDIAC